MHEKDCLSLKKHTKSHIDFHAERHFGNVPVDQPVQLLHIPALSAEHPDPVHGDQPAPVVGVYEQQH